MTKEFKTVKVKKQKHVATVCNKCGKREEGDKSSYFARIGYTGGYDSNAKEDGMGDLERLNIDLCEKCLVTLAESCVVKPDWHCILDGDSIWNDRYRYDENGKKNPEWPENVYRARERQRKERESKE